MTGRSNPLPGLTGLGSSVLPGLVSPVTSASAASVLSRNPFITGYNVLLTYSESNMRAENFLGTTALLSVPKQTGKWSLEFELINHVNFRLGIRSAYGSGTSTTQMGSGALDYGYVGTSGSAINNGVATAYGPVLGATGYFAVLFDGDAGTVSFAVDGTNYGVAFSSIASAYFPGISGNSAASDVRISTTNYYNYGPYLPWR